MLYWALPCRDCVTAVNFWFYLVYRSRRITPSEPHLTRLFLFFTVPWSTPSAGWNLLARWGNAGMKWFSFLFNFTNEVWQNENFEARQKMWILICLTLIPLYDDMWKKVLNIQHYVSPWTRLPFHPTWWHHNVVRMLFFSRELIAKWMELNKGQFWKKTI